MGTRVGCVRAENCYGKAARGILVYGATFLPWERAASYFTVDGEAARQTVNAWIRASGVFDGVIDFAVVTRDRKTPSRLSAAVHPCTAGYRIMADAADLKLFAGFQGPTR